MSVTAFKVLRLGNESYLHFLHFLNIYYIINFALETFYPIKEIKVFRCFLLAHEFINVPTLFIILLFYNGNAAQLDFAFGHNYIIAQVLLLNKQKN